MTFVLANCHGDLEKFRAMLGKIHLTENDLLYVLGDMTDYGTDSIDLLIDMSMRANVYPIAGEHDLRALRMLSGFSKMLEEGGAPTAEFADEMKAWFADGGAPTMEGFRALDAEMREGVLDYLSEFALYEEVRAGGKDFVLTHAGIGNFAPETPLDDYPPEAFFTPPAAGQTFFQDKTLVVGHTPTDGKIRREGGVIYVDCGVLQNGVLGCLCLETGEEFYV